ncbi:MAG: uracil-DNA glycosylase [Candidatus Aenigmarchaeota archaeon]|nr:uracil-DNA glycosylase [Candidatus Aenigmarchaeota archaeon]
MRKEILLEKIFEEIKVCKKCSLWKTRKNPVLGEGDPNSKIMLIGLGPGKQEDAEGRPFVGAAGKFLNKLLKLAGMKREGVYITNVMKCFLPQNKVAEEQIRACSPYLERQIEIIKPRVIITLGNVATDFIFEKFGLQKHKHSISKIHAQIFKVSTLVGELTIIPMYHPATALYNPGLKETLREDWMKVGKYLKLKGFI